MKIIIYCTLNLILNFHLSAMQDDSWLAQFQRLDEIASVDDWKDIEENEDLNFLIICDQPYTPIQSAIDNKKIIGPIRKKRKLRCIETCSEKFESPDDRIKHMVEDHLKITCIDSTTCPICIIGFTKSRSLYMHLKNSHLNGHKCYKCGKYISLKNKNKHKNKHNIHTEH